MTTLATQQALPQAKSIEDFTVEQIERMNEQAKGAITKVRVQVLNTQPFWGCLLLSLKPTLSWFQPTMAVDGAHMYYNPHFVLSLSKEDLYFVALHEACHPSLLHHLRVEERDRKQWNIAADHAANLMLSDIPGLTLPKSALANPGFKGNPAETIYKFLDQQKDDKQGQEPGGGGGGSQQGQGKSPGGSQPPPPGGGQPQRQGPVSPTATPQAHGERPELGKPLDLGPNPQDIDPGRTGAVLQAPKGDVQSSESSWKQKVATALRSKAAGSLSAGMRREFEDMLEPKVDWRAYLQRYFLDRARDDYRWSPANRRFVHQELYLPSAYSEKMGEMVICCDTSGSVTEEMMQEYASELQGVMMEVKPTKLHVIYVDSKVCGHDEVLPEDLVDVLEPKGGGGTDFRPVFKYLKKHDIEPAVLIYFTDGYCRSYPDDTPEFDTLWCAYDDGFEQTGEPPFGEILKIELDSMEEERI